MDGAESRRRRELTVVDLERARIPRRYWDVKFDCIMPADAKHRLVVEKYIAGMPAMVSDGYGLILWGDNSTGKTSIAIVIAKEARRWGFSCLFIRASDFIDASLERVSFDDSVTLKDRARHVDLLVIDDLGKEHKADSGWSVRAFDNLIRYRVQEKLATIITANIGPKKIMALYKPSMVKAMLGVLYPIEVKGHDYRAEEARKLEQIFLGQGAHNGH